MNTTRKILGALVLTMSIPLTSYALTTTPPVIMAGNEGGGGGGICFGGVCRTLAETGFRLAPVGPEFEIDQEALEMLEKIRSQLPRWLRYKYDRGIVVGHRGTVVAIEVQDQEKVRLFIEEYKTIIRRQTPDFNFADFQLLGFSVEKKTYLIADKFNRLRDPLSRAMLLLHEMYIRVYKSTVADAVRLDGMVLDYLKAKQENRFDDFDFWSFYRVLGDAGLIDKNKAHSMMIAESFKRGMTSDDLKSIMTFAGSMEIDYSKALDMRRFHPRFAQDLGDKSFLVEGSDRREVAHQLSSILKAIPANQTVTFTAKDLNSKIAVENSLSLCGDRGDNKYVFTTKSLDEQTSVMEEVLCYLGEDIYLGDVTAASRARLFQGFTGGTFNFAGEVKCKSKPARTTYSSYLVYECN